MKYTIVYVNNRSKKNIEHNKTILKDFEYVEDIEFFDGSIKNGMQNLIDRGINITKWNPYDGRSTAPLPGEFGVWVTTINILEYIVKNKIDKMLILEDDIILKNNFIDILNKSINDLPLDFDFLSMYWNDGHNNVDERTLIGSKYIHKSLNSYSGALAMIYSYRGAKNILKALQRKGMEYTNDCFIYKMSHIGVLNGFSLMPEIGEVVLHDWDALSVIDPDNFRMTKKYEYIF